MLFMAQYRMLAIATFEHSRDCNVSYSLTPTHTHTHARAHTHTRTPAHTYTCTHSLNISLTHSFAHSFTHLLTHSLTHPSIHSHTHFEKKTFKQQTNVYRLGRPTLCYSVKYGCLNEDVTDFNFLFYNNMTARD